MLQRLSHDIAEKIMVILFAIFTVLTPIHGMVMLIFLFVLLDTITGIYVVVKKEGWTKFNSHKLFNIVPKLFLYTITIIMSFAIDEIIFKNGIMDIKDVFAKTITMVWIYIEVKSINENSQKLGNKSFWLIIKDILFKIKDIKKNINDIKKDD